MKATIGDKGQLVLTAENEAEKFVVREWSRRPPAIGGLEVVENPFRTNNYGTLSVIFSPDPEAAGEMRVDILARQIVDAIYGGLLEIAPEGSDLRRRLDGAYKGYCYNVWTEIATQVLREAMLT